MWLVRIGHGQGGWEGKLKSRKMKLITVKEVD
jgi:hypothetical protein